MNPENLAPAILVGILTGAASAWMNLLVMGERLRRVEDTTRRLAANIEGPEGLNVRVGIIEKSGVR